MTIGRKHAICSPCEKTIRNNLAQVRAEFLNSWEGDGLTLENLKNLYNRSQMFGLDWQEVLGHVRADALQQVERYLTFAAADGIVTAEEFKKIVWFGEVLQIPENQFSPTLKRAIYLKSISDISAGRFPVISPSVHLDTDEICHFESQSQFYKNTARSTRIIEGRLLISSKRIHFLSISGGWIILWKNVMRSVYDTNGVFLELSVKNGNGYYSVGDPVLTATLINTLCRVNKRQIIANGELETTRHIPQQVKITVWQRDQGKCVQCSAVSYLEFDHIIPFSMGGSNSERNIQLLCRKCNLSKRDRL
jgi:hypothetical protein